MQTSGIVNFTIIQYYPSQALMMVGLPASGKTTWVQKYTSENKHMKYNVLGSNDLLDKMKVRINTTCCSIVVYSFSDSA